MEIKRQRREEGEEKAILERERNR
jgi:hypothetical protein